ncbi:FxsA family protein [Kangiella sediminilitoris]|uniref:FxsA cytoplasmic membrane protein n=1 Tax=Kangiella sediminilitoris TaxID=1144748 RepID=A0A1B3BDJ3_9GAMM|nr:FxsA family protein [Kangiella sediminilitoris]AOE50838.1 FxsA cytoplasmic membrane protein [Kangiella sediminilitoris]
MWFRNFLIVLLLIAIAEIYVLIGVGGVIGTAPTVFLVLLTGVIGISMLRQQGFSVFARLQEKMQQGQPPAQEMVEGVLLIIAGAFLITPGFITDIIGFLWLIPQTRVYFARLLIKKGTFKVQGVSSSTFHQSDRGPYGYPKQPEDDNTIDGEYERTDEKNHDRLEK